MKQKYIYKKRQITKQRDFYITTHNIIWYIRYDEIHKPKKKVNSLNSILDYPNLYWNIILRGPVI